jgi:fatty acid desaturase
MQAVPNEILQRAYERRLNHFIKLPLLWSLAFVLGYLGYWAVHHLGNAAGIPIAIVCGIGIGLLDRGIGSIGHDAAHGAVSRNKLVNYLMGYWAWSVTLFPYTLYRAYHLDHHKIVNMPHDIDRVQVSRFTSNPRLAVALRMAIYFGGYPVYWMLDVGRYMPTLSAWGRVRVVLESASFYVALIGLYFLMGPVAFFAVVLSKVIAGAFFASITSMTEHFGIPYHPDHAYTSRTYASKSAFLDWLWSGTPYHIEHHKYPGIPYYNLRAFHYEALPYYSAEVRANVHEDFWPLVFKLWGLAAKPNLEEERAIAQRDRAALESSKDSSGLEPEVA